MADPNFDPNVGKKTQFTPENAREMMLRGLEVRRRMSQQRAVWEAPADLPKEIADFYGLFGFKGARLKLIDNKYKLAYKGLKKAYDKGDLNAIFKFFSAVGLDWAAEQATFIAAYNATIKAREGDSEDEDDKKIEVVIKRASK